jgi:hypothetical protein
MITIMITGRRGEGEGGGIRDGIHDGIRDGRWCRRLSLP